MNALFRPVVFAFALALSTPAVFADVTTEVFITNSGARGMGAHEVTTVRKIQGVKSREDSSWKFTGKALRILAGRPKEGTQIVRVDLDKMWSLNPKKETYTERPIKVDLPKEADRKEAPREDEGPSEPEEPPTHRVKSTSLDVKKTGEKKAVNGFNTEEAVVTARMELEEIATKEVTAYEMETRLWLAPMTAALKRSLAEEKKFMRAYLAKLGGGLSPEDRSKFGIKQLALVLGLGGEKTEDVLQRVKAKMAALNGYPVVTDTKWIVEEDPKAVARRKATQAERDEDEESIDFSANPKDIAGGLFGRFAKKKLRERREEKAAEREGEPIFAVRTEVKRVSTDKIPAGDFEVPEGYKLIN